MSLLLNTALFIRNNASALNITMSERSVLISLATRIGKNKKTWISQTKLAEEVGLSERHLRRLIGRFKQMGILSVIKSWKNNHYYLDQEKLITGHGCPMKEKLSPDIRVLSDGLSPDMGVRITGHICPMKTPENTSQPIELNKENHKENKLKETIKINKKIKETKKESAIALPDWLPLQHWLDLLEHRRNIKAPMGPVAQRRAIQKLAVLRSQGQDVIEVIDQTIVNGWKGLFPVPKPYAQHGANANGYSQQPQQHYVSARARSIHEYLARLNAD